MKTTSSIAARSRRGYTSLRGYTSRRGFTLVELLIVIAIIGILAGVVIVSVTTARSKASATRVQAEVGQVRTRIEQSLANNSYLDLSGGTGNVDALVATSSGYADISTLLCDIGKQNGYSDAVTNDITLTCDGTPNLHTGVVILSNSTDWKVNDYAVYATSTPSGYFCVDSYGNANSTTTASIPDYTGINATSTTLCQ